MKYFAVSGYSNSGKTSLISDIAREIRDRDLKIAVIKHSGHSIIAGEKDTDKFLKAGINNVTFWGKDGYISYSKSDVELSELLTRYDTFDFVIIEGGKHIDALPKVWIGSPDSEIKNIVAIITGEEKKWNIPTFERKNISSLVSFLLSL